MIEEHKMQFSKNDCEDSPVNNQKTTLVLLKDKPRKNIDETINTPESYVSWFQASTSNLDKYLEICPHCKKNTMQAFHRTVINNAVDYLEGKRMFGTYIPNQKNSFPIISLVLAIATGVYFLLSHIVDVIKG